jgi:hypothetical protein
LAGSGRSFKDPGQDRMRDEPRLLRLWIGVSRNPDSTVPSHPIPSVVIVAPAPGVLEMWLELLQDLEDVPSIQIATLSNVTTAVARWRPIAIVVEQEVFEFDEREFEELARDVKAELVRVRSPTNKWAVATSILPKLRAALVRWEARTFA